ncbi:MAG: hypothetical protein I8H95_07050 [Rhodocyclales bacterium]|jgi:hypothetical protein|nr:hypothetical protein [Rhodocyclales bacterium]
MTVIMRKIISAIVRRIWRSLMLVIVVTEVRNGFLALIMPLLAIVGRHSPGYLEGEQEQHEEHKEASHGKKYIALIYGNNE